jgi:hypothetical protein
MNHRTHESFDIIFVLCFRHASDYSNGRCVPQSNNLFQSGFCEFSCITALDVHLLQTQTHDCRANHIADTVVSNGACMAVAGHL